MLQLYNLEHAKIKGLKKYKDYCIESVLSTGDKTLSFLYPSHLAKDIIEESYIRNKTAEFVVKEIADQEQWKSIKAVLNVEDLEGKEWEQFDSTEQTITDCLRLAIAGTGWTIGTCNVTRRRTVRKTNCSAWDIIQEAKKRYRVELEFDSLNKKINIAEKLGADKGAYFMDSLNLKNLNVQSNSYDFYTRIIAKGKEDLKVTVENFQYSNKIKTLIWKDERYTVLESLTEDATAKLEELSKPYRAYSADIIDLANMSDKYKNILEYGLGDTITLISKEKGVREKQRIVKIKEYPEEPDKNTCEIANATLKFEDVQKEQQDTTDTVNNITEDNGTISSDAVKGAFTVLNKLNVNEINALKGQFGELKVNKLDVDTANIKFAEIDKAVINKADITQLNAVSAKINVLEADSANINTILAGSIGSGSVQTIHLTGENVVFEDAVIKDLIARKITVSDLLAGNIDASKFNIVSSDGKLTIKDNTILIKDGTRARVQIGKDANGDYSLYAWDNQGNLMFDALGLKTSAIKDKIIRDDMISDSANISGSKLNISSLITEVNKEANTNLIKSNKVAIDLQGQTLDIAFNALQTSVSGLNSITSNLQTQISANNGQIETLVKDTNIEKNGTTIKLKDAYTRLEQTVTGINSIVASNSSSINGLSSSISSVQSNISQLQNQISLKVEQADIDQTIADVITTTDTKISSAKAEIKATTDSITSRVTNVESTTSTINGKVTNQETRLQEAERKITPTAIISTVTSSTAYAGLAQKSEISSLIVQNADSVKIAFGQISGNNLIRNSSWYFGLNSWVASSGTNVIVSTQMSVGDGYGIAFPVEPGKTKWVEQEITSGFNKFSNKFTISLYLNAGDFTPGPNAFYGVEVAVKYKDGTVGYPHIISPSPYWNFYKKTFSTDNKEINKIVVYLYGRDGSGKVYFAKVKLEEGDIATAWSPHTDEIYNSSVQVDGNGLTINGGNFKLLNKFNDVALSTVDWWTYAQGALQVAVAPSHRDTIRGTTLYNGGNASLKAYGITHETFYGHPFIIGTNGLKVDMRNMVDTDWANLEANSISGESIYSNHAIGNHVQLIRNEVNIKGSQGSLWLNYKTDAACQVVVADGSGTGTWGALVANSLRVTGSKNCIQDTEHYGYRAINAYETADYYFGDIGEGTIGTDGLCYVSIDDVFVEVVNTKCNYQVFLTKYGPGDLWIKERTENYFIIEGTSGLLFGWELKAKRKGFETDRLEPVLEPPKVSMDFSLSPEDEEVLNSSNTTKDTLYAMDDKVRQEAIEREQILMEV